MTTARNPSSSPIISSVSWMSTLARVRQQRHVELGREHPVHHGLADLQIVAQLRVGLAGHGLARSDALRHGLVQLQLGLAPRR